MSCGQMRPDRAFWKTTNTIFIGEKIGNHSKKITLQRVKHGAKEAAKEPQNINEVHLCFGVLLHPLLLGTLEQNVALSVRNLRLCLRSNSLACVH